MRKPSCASQAVRLLRPTAFIFNKAMLPSWTQGRSRTEVPLGACQAGCSHAPCASPGLLTCSGSGVWGFRHGLGLAG